MSEKLGQDCPNDHENTSDQEEDELCQPPATFSVETFTPEDQKLNWLIFTSGFMCNPSPTTYPGNPFHPIGATIICGLCRLRRRAFYCEDCIRKGEFGHSNLRRPEYLSEKRLKELELSRRMEALKSEIEKRTNIRQKVMLLNEQIKSCKQRTKHLKYLVENEKAKLVKNLNNKAIISSVNIRRRQRLPEFADKVRKISECLRKFTANLESEKNATGHKLKVLAGTRRKYAEDIGRHIFSICIEENRPETDAPKQGSSDDPGISRRFSCNIVEEMGEAMGYTTSSSPHEYSVSASQYDFQSSRLSQLEPDRVESSDHYFTEIADEIIDAMATSYIHGRWVTALHSRSQDARLYRIVSAVISSVDESPAFPALTDRETELARMNENHTVAAGLTFSAQLLSLLSACFDTLLPKRIHFSDFGIPPKTEFKFYKLISRLNLNIVYLCLAQGINPSELRPKQFLHNLYVLFDHVKKDNLSTIGLANRPIRPTDTMFSMSQAICADLDILSEDHANADSEEESENDEFRDWESVAPGASGPAYGESFPIFQSSHIMQPQYSGISTASTFMTSLFRGFSSGTNN